MALTPEEKKTWADIVFEQYIRSVRVKRDTKFSDISSIMAEKSDEEVRASIALYKLQKNSAIDKKIQELQTQKIA